jgi:FixJ family two-component response regulator
LRSVNAVRHRQAHEGAVTLHAKPLQSQVLVVEDDAALRESLSYLLESEGYAVRVFENGEALLQAPLPKRDACLVLDEHLPELSGTETLLKLRARGVGLPALIVTTNPKGPLRLAALAARAYIVQKPLVGDAFLAHVSAALAAQDD